MDRARLRANNVVRRRKGVAEEVWLARRRIARDGREAIAATAGSEEPNVLQERGLVPGRRLLTLLGLAVHREAIRRALVAHGILHFKRRLIPLPVKSGITDKVG